MIGEPSPEDVAAAIPEIGRLLPQSEEAEKAVLAALVMEPAAVGAFCAARRVSPQWFHIPAHRIAYGVLMTLWSCERQMDFVTISEALRNQKAFEAVGGAPFVTSLFTFLPTASLVEHYIGIIHEKALLRRVIQDCTSIAARCYESGPETARLVCEYQQKAAAVTAEIAAPRKTTAQLTDELMADIRSGNRQKLFGRPTGFPRLDAHIGGLADGDLILIQGEKSSGKSAFALNIAEAYDRIYGLGCTYFTFEMSAKQQLKRLIQMRSGENIRAALGDAGDMFSENAAAKRVETAAAHVREMKIDFYDSKPATVEDCVAELRRRKASGNLGLAVLDYDELLDPEIRRHGSKEQSLAHIAQTWKNIGGELEIPTILLSQVTLDKDGSVKSRWSQAKENFANIMLLVREQEDGSRNVLIQKNRDGRRHEEIQFQFIGKTTRFLEMKEVKEK